MSLPYAHGVLTKPSWIGESVQDDGVSPTTEAVAKSPGGILRAARMERGLSAEFCAERLKARVGQVHSIEADDFAPLGGDIYTRGFLKSYAQIVGVDPAEVLRLHGHDPSATFNPLSKTLSPLEQRRIAPAWLLTLLGLVGVGLVVAAVLMLGGQRAPSAVPSVEVPTAVPPATVVPAPPAPTSPAPAPAPAPVGPPLEIVMTFEATSWLEVVVDGIVVEPGVLARRGETLRFVAQEEIIARYGNAGGVRVELNTLDLGPQGRSGEVVRVRYTPDGRAD